MCCLMPSLLFLNPAVNAAECTAYIKGRRVGCSGRRFGEGELHVEEAALERNHHRVGAVARAEFRKNAFEVALYRVLGDA